MSSKREHNNSGLTLIEVMISMLAILLILMGSLTYMYGCIWNARKAEVRITATRIGQILLEKWKLTGHYFIDSEGVQHWTWDVIDFNPTLLTVPLVFSNDNFDLTAGGISGTELGDYKITIDSVAYFVTLLYDDAQPNMLGARIAWNKNLHSATLDSDFHYIDVASYAIY